MDGGASLNEIRVGYLGRPTYTRQRQLPERPHTSDDVDDDVWGQQYKCGAQVEQKESPNESFR